MATNPKMQAKAKTNIQPQRRSNAQRQADYRARHLKDENAQLERLSLLVDLHAKRALERLASCYGVTQRAMLERFREWCLAMISPELCGTLFPRLRASLRVHDQLETQSTITLKQASMIAEIRRRE